MEILKYCTQDCEILRQAVVKFRTLLSDITGYCPFTESVTLASYVNLVYRARYMPEKSIALLPRSAFCQKRNASFEFMQWLFYRQTLDAVKIRTAFSHPNGEAKRYKHRVDGLAPRLSALGVSGVTVYEYNGVSLVEEAIFIYQT